MSAGEQVSAMVLPPGTGAAAPRGGVSTGEPISVAERLVGLMACELEDGAVVATGVASPLAILAIAAARATHAPRLTYIACVGSLDPDLPALRSASEDLASLEGRSAEVPIPDLFDHARRGRVDTIFFGAAEVDGVGRTNLSAAGSLQRPVVKFPGVAGACSLRRWIRHPVLVVPRQSRRNLVPHVQVASTRDDRPTLLLTDLAAFEVGPAGAALLGRQPGAAVEEIRDRTGFTFVAPEAVPVLPPPPATLLAAIRRIDSAGHRDQLVG